MEPLYFWVLIGLLGFLLYISPGFLVYRMYESFEALDAVKKATAPSASAKAEVNTAGPTAVNLTASPAPKPTPNQIQNLLEVLNTPPPVASPTAPASAIGSAGLSARPIEHESTRSQPMPTREPQMPSMALKQGDSFKATLPLIPAPGPQGMLGAMGTQPLVPAERIVYIERPRERDCDNDQCDRPASNPNCPDMRDYIRKDSIPCWGCKLR